MTANSLPCGCRDGTDPTLDPSEHDGNVCSLMAYDVATYEAVMALLGKGLSDYKIAQRTGVPRGTVRNWRLARNPPLTVQRDVLAAEWSVRNGAAYS